MNYLITLCFAKPEVLIKGITRTRSLMTTTDVRHYLQNQHYPLYVDAIKRTMIDLAETSPHIVLIDSGGPVGLLKGFNYFLSQIDLKPNDKVLIADPDSWIVTKGWDTALLRVLDHPQVAWASLMNTASIRELPERGYDEVDINGIKCWRTKAPCVNNVCGFRGDFLLSVGGFHAFMEHYGHMETATWMHVLRQNKAWVYLCDYTETDTDGRPEHDQAYLDWKICYAHTRTWMGDFESYLAAGCPKGGK